MLWDECGDICSSGVKDQTSDLQLAEDCSGSWATSTTVTFCSGPLKRWCFTYLNHMLLVWVHLQAYKITPASCYHLITNTIHSQSFKGSSLMTPLMSSLFLYFLLLHSFCCTERMYQTLISVYNYWQQWLMSTLFSTSDCSSRPSFMHTVKWVEVSFLCPGECFKSGQHTDRCAATCFYWNTWLFFKWTPWISCHLLCGV